MSSSPQRIIFAGVRCLGWDSAARLGPCSGVAQFIAARHVPLVFCTGRTRAEVEHIQHHLGIADPFICEHGAAVFVRNDYFGESLQGVRRVGEYLVLEFGRPYTEVAAAVQRAAARVRARIVGFSEMSIADVAVACDVPLLSARLAQLREYEEAFRVVDDDATKRRLLRQQLQAAQLSCVSEGAFDFAGPSVDLGVGAQWLIALYRRQGPIITVGIGDQLHHAPLLRRVDMPIIVPRDEVTTRQLNAAVPRARIVDPTDGRRLVDMLAPVLGPPSWSAAS